jgi:ABC-type dipeptide/oligopeptide/nickel transport system ATPase subunit
MLIAENLGFGYRSRRILSGFSLSLKRGESVGLSAPSGRGKTTLLKLLAGYTRPEQGSVLLRGKPVSSYEGYCPVQMIWQHPELVINPRIKLSETLSEARLRYEDLPEGLGIRRDWLSRYPGELSGGELQRFNIARALKDETEFILADEITAMHDLITQAQIWKFLTKEAKKRNIGLLAVSHSQPLLDELCTRQIVLD